MERSPIGVSLNFDSLNEACGFPAGFKDPCFFEGFDRLAHLAGKYGIALSIYIIGRDLDNPEIAARVADWAAQGHEIGNHSLSHKMNLGALAQEELVKEVKTSHERIGEVTGHTPRGFIAPAWSSSKQLISYLHELGYLYDTSHYTSVLLPAVQMKVALNHWNNPNRVREILNRKDWLNSLFLSKTPFAYGQDARRLNNNTHEERPMVELPLPTRGLWHIPCWHTKGLIMNWAKHLDEVDHLLTHHPYFYYLIHPADFMDINDIPSAYSHSLARLEIPVAEKLSKLEEVFSMLAQTRRPMGTLSLLAEHFLASPPQ